MSIIFKKELTMKLSRKLLPFLLIVVSLSAWTCTIGSSPPPPNPHSYSYSFLGTFNDPGFPNISIQLTPLIPPKLLSTLPSDYLQVDVTVGTLHFSTSNPVYKCLEAVVPLIFTEEIAYPGLFIAVYNNCGKIILPSSPSEAMLGHLSLATQQYAMFTFPRNSSLCSTSSSGQSQCILPVNPTPTPVNPTPTPVRSEEHTSELQSPDHLVCRLLLEKKKKTRTICARVLGGENPYD